jgi:hypothetical protein
MSIRFYKVILFRKSYDFKIIKRKKQTCLGSYISQNEIILHHEIKNKTQSVKSLLTGFIIYSGLNIIRS